jgi:hypothetical protein
MNLRPDQAVAAVVESKLDSVYGPSKSVSGLNLNPATIS